MYKNLKIACMPHKVGADIDIQQYKYHHLVFYLISMHSNTYALSCLQFYAFFGLFLAKYPIGALAYRLYQI